MPSIYSSQYTLDNGLGPTSSDYEPIPNLDALKITDDFLQFGGTAQVSLYLGYAYSGDINSFSFYVSIVDTSTNEVVTETFFGGQNGISTVVSISVVYDIKPQSQPNLVAQWKVLGTTPSVVIQPPVTLSLSAIVFETEGT